MAADVQSLMGQFVVAVALCRNDAVLMAAEHWLFCEFSGYFLLSDYAAASHITNSSVANCCITCVCTRPSSLNAVQLGLHASHM